MKFNPENTLFLIDASHFLYRSYYGLPPLRTKTGETVQAVFAFCRTLKKIMNEYSPQYMVLVWDSPGKTKRQEIYTEYKATRQTPPSDLFSQKKRIQEFAEIIGIKQFAKEGVEADDLIATLSKKFEDEMTIIILSSDKDLGQLLQKNVFLLDTFKEKIYDKTTFEEKIGFPVEHLPLFYGLMGDASDNIPGVSGIGKKSAEELAKKYSSMQNLYDHIDEIESKRVKNALISDKKNAFLSESLFLLDIEPILIQKEELTFNVNDWQKAKDFFKELNFTSFLSSTADQGKTEINPEKQKLWEKYNFKTIQAQEDLDALIKKLETVPFFAFDTETTGVHALNADLVGVSFCYEIGSAFYVPCGHTTIEKQVKLPHLISKIKPILENEKLGKIAHNAKYDLLVLSNYGINVEGVICDTYIASQLVFEESIRSGLKSLSEYVFNEEMFSYDEIIKTEGVKNFSQVSLDLATLYSAADSHQTFRLKEIVEKKLEEQKLVTIYKEIELPLIHVLISMEKTGIYCDKEKLQLLNVEIEKKIKQIEDAIYGIINNSVINLNSPAQVRVLLFEVLNLPPQKKSPKGVPSTDVEVLELLQEMHPVPKLLKEYRELTKLKTTYIDALPTYISKKDNKIHTSFFQLKTATGRLSSNNPNLQNIPADMKSIGGEIRAAFLPEKDHFFIAVDYSQIELRVLAFLSQDPILMHAFLNDHDIHTETAARIFEIPFTEVHHEQRQVGKRINFSILYGLTPFGLSKDLKIPYADAKKYISTYFQQYEKVPIWMESVIKFAKEHGYVETWWGRRRAITNIYQKNKNLYEEAKRIAINTVAQGTAADLVKKGMIKVHDWAEKEMPEVKILLQIHDELLISAPKNDIENTAQKIQKMLESIVSWNVPLKVTARWGKNWKEVSK